MKNVTVEQLAERLEGKVWSKNGMTRIYLDRGYNTKKMTTKTYVFLREDGSWGVSCYIECPSQPYQWIKSQTEGIVSSVEKELDAALATEYYLLVNDATGEYIGEDGKATQLNDLYSNDYFLTEAAANKFITEELKEGYLVKEIDRFEFETKVAELDAIREANRPKPEPKVITPTIVEEVKPTIKNTDNPTYGVGTKVQHKTFGIGTVITEGDKLMEIDFGNAGIKKLIIAYAQLTKI